MIVHSQDLSVADVVRAYHNSLCRERGIRCVPPGGGGSHWKVSDRTQRDILTIPQRRPIKPVYIRRLVELVEETRDAAP
jgi:hypothetical protein